MDETVGPVGAIDNFRGEFRFLSNFFEAPIEINGKVFPTVEHAFQWAKAATPEHKESILRAATPGESRSLGRRCVMRTDWEAIKFDVMLRALREKFGQHPQLRDQLVATGDDLLIEVTGSPQRAWHDQVYGQCMCDTHKSQVGRNVLGRMLMKVRSEVRGDRPDRFPRVAVTGNRPHKMNEEQREYARVEVVRTLVELITHHDAQVALSGMALGVDTMWADTALESGMQLWSYVPFEAQASGWSVSDVEQWKSLRSAASREVIVANSPGNQFYHARNDLLIRDSNLLVAICDPADAKGGAVSTARKAIQAGHPTIVADLGKLTTYSYNMPAPATQ